MTITLVLPGSLADDIMRAARQDVEVAGVLIVAPMETPSGELRLLGNKMEWVKPDGYLEQYSDGLRIASHGYVPALADAERSKGMAMWLHTHPGQAGLPVPSRHDRKVDKEIADVFRIRTGSRYYGTLIVSPRNEDVIFTGTDRDGSSVFRVAARSVSNHRCRSGGAAQTAPLPAPLEWFAPTRPRCKS